jgi:hypothetical protein
MAETVTSSTSLEQLANLTLARHSDAELKSANTKDKQTPNDIDFESLNKHGITMLALYNDWLEGPAKTQAEQIRHQAIAHELFVKHALDDLFQHLHDKLEHNWIVIKGTGLAYMYYPQPWLRPRTDVDILIDPENYSLASQALANAGYVKMHAIEGSLINHQASFCKQLSDHKSITVDLHWRLSNRHSLAHCFSVEELKQTATVITDLNRYATMPDAVNALLIACIHRTGHHHKDDRIMWLYDIHLLAENLDAEQWQQLCDYASKKRISALCNNALLTCKSLFKSDIPESVFRYFEQTSLKSEPTAQLLSDLPSWRYLLIDIKTLNWKDRFRFLIQNLFPSIDYMRIQFPNHPIVVAYLWRFVRGIKRLSI